MSTRCSVYCGRLGHFFRDQGGGDFYWTRPGGIRWWWIPGRFAWARLERWLYEHRAARWKRGLS